MALLFLKKKKHCYKMVLRCSEVRLISNFSSNIKTSLAKECEKYGSVTFYWYRTTLDISNDLSDGWTVNNGLFFCYLIVWAVLLIIAYKGIESVGKVRTDL
jgi:Sodium:neurotransmitter symporter family.